jgi:hypothetical protein
MSSAKTVETTNGKIDQLIEELDVLIEWASSDKEHALDNDGTDTAEDDQIRINNLLKAKDLILDSKR